LRVGPPEILAPTRGQRIEAFETSRDGRWLVAVTRKAFLVFDPEKPGEAVRAESAVEPGHYPHLSPDGQIAASIATSQRFRVQVWNARNGALLTNLPIVNARHLAFSPDGRWLACAATDATTLWRTADWTPRHRFPHPPEAPGRNNVAFSPDGRVMAASVSDQSTRLTLVETGEELGTLPTDRMVNSLAFNPGGDCLVAACEPGYFQFWNLRYLRAQLAGMKLDWPGPPLPAQSAARNPTRVTVVLRTSEPFRTASEKRDGQ
jgi:WD40 repeat protein